MRRQWLQMVMLGCAAPALGQTGVLDQFSPYPVLGPLTANFNLDGTQMIWRQQVRAGIGGRLEGVRFLLFGTAPSSAALRVRRGTAASPGQVLATATVQRSQAANELVFVDLSLGSIEIAAGEPFVLELQGGGNGLWIYGTHAAPPQTPQYSEPLHLNGLNFDDGGWRIGFETYMLTGDVCPGDLTSSSDPGDAGYGIRDGMVDASDFFYFLDQFTAGNSAVADLTGSSDPNDPAYGDPDGAVDASDFFYYLDLFVRGC